MCSTSSSCLSDDLDDTLEGERKSEEKVDPAGEDFGWRGVALQRVLNAQEQHIGKYESEHQLIKAMPLDQPNATPSNRAVYGPTRPKSGIRIKASTFRLVCLQHIRHSHSVVQQPSLLALSKLWPTSHTSSTTLLVCVTPKTSSRVILLICSKLESYVSATE